MYTRMLLNAASSGSDTGTTTGCPLDEIGTGTARLHRGKTVAWVRELQGA